MDNDTGIGASPVIVPQVYSYIKSSSVVLLQHNYVCDLHLPYSRLFSLGANFHEFPKWTHNSGNLFCDAGRTCVTTIFLYYNTLHPIQGLYSAGKHFHYNYSY